ncbi:MAG: hypothetical protein WCZ18_07305 [Ottowia sp.]|nr:hypothetical protein [Ottowia sp.]
MNGHWRVAWGMPLLSRLPRRVGWQLAARIGHVPRRQQRATLDFLSQRFAQVFPLADAAQRRRWARQHLAMLAHELTDAFALDRIGAAGGPQVALQGWAHVQALRESGSGFILVLNHFDRLLVAPVALARRGLRLNNLTMPVLENTDLSDADRRFLLRKIRLFTDVTGGQWRTTRQSLRPVIQGLRAGEAWIVLADAWRPEFGRLREHRFLDGSLRLPTGVERLAQAAGVPMLQATTYSDRADQLRVEVLPLPDNGPKAVDQVISTLDRDVRARPWAWWHWGLLEQMWHTLPRDDRAPETSR